VEASKGEFNKHDTANTPASISGKQLKSVSSDKLISLAAANASFFTSPDETAWASIEVKGHRETHAISSPRFKTWLIAGDGWRVRPRTPVPFRRQKGMLALPEPVRGGSIEALRPFLNVARNDDFIPDPLLALAAEPGAAKSTAAKAIRSLVDPKVSALRSAPREERDVWIAAKNASALAYDNISSPSNHTIASEHSLDLLCCASISARLPVSAAFRNSSPA
jgi:hypothetical protein